MSDITVEGGRVAWRGRLGTETVAVGHAPDARRGLQLALAGVWLLDALLQYQPFMYTKAFGQMLAATASGNPGVIARPITWNAALVEHHAVALNTVFATIQLLLGLGIAVRPTVRLALGASIAWSLGVWWFGEGLGGVLNGTADPVSGAPGAVIFYALLAVLLWPADRPGGPLGPRAARALWLVLWLSMAWFALQPGSRAHHGLAASIALAAVFTLVAIGVYLPPPAARAAPVLAIVVAVVIWVVGQAFGMIPAGGATDPNSGPLLILLALAYWPVKGTRSQ